MVYHVPYQLTGIMVCDKTCRFTHSFLPHGEISPFPETSWPLIRAIEELDNDQQAFNVTGDAIIVGPEPF